MTWENGLKHKERIFFLMQEASNTKDILNIDVSVSIGKLNETESEKQEHGNDKK